MIDFYKNISASKFDLSEKCTGSLLYGNYVKQIGNVVNYEVLKSDASDFGIIFHNVAEMVIKEIFENNNKLDINIITNQVMNTLEVSFFNGVREKIIMGIGKVIYPYLQKIINNADNYNILSEYKCVVNEYKDDTDEDYKFKTVAIIDTLLITETDNKIDIYIIDYKTSEQEIDIDKHITQLQMGMYSYVQSQELNLKNMLKKAQNKEKEYKFHCVIVQPYSFELSTSKEKVYDIFEVVGVLQDINKRIRGVIEKAGRFISDYNQSDKNVINPYTPGYHCRWCSLTHTCPAVVNELEKIEKDLLPSADGPYLKELSVEDRDDFMDRLKSVNKFIDDNQALFREGLKNGLFESESYRTSTITKNKWKEIAIVDIIARLRELGMSDEQIFKKTEIKPVATLRKLLGQDLFDSEVSTDLLDESSYPRLDRIKRQEDKKDADKNK